MGSIVTNHKPEIRLSIQAGFDFDRNVEFPKRQKIKLLRFEFTHRAEICEILIFSSRFSAQLGDFLSLLKAETPPIATRSDVLLSSTFPFLWEESLRFQWAEGHRMLFTFFSSL